jgi:hypothetical protein
VLPDRAMLLAALLVALLAATGETHARFYSTFHPQLADRRVMHFSALKIKHDFSIKSALDFVTSRDFIARGGFYSARNIL